MSRRSIPALDAEFINVMSFIGARKMLTTVPGEELTASAKRIHRATHSLILWRFRLKGLPRHGKPFIEEIASDALQILPQALMGYRKAAKLLTRGIVENTLRHIYFSDHPIEFARMNREAKWYMSMESLFEYPKTHPIFLGTEPKFDAINRLSSLYSDLSAGVHGRTVNDFEMHKALNRIVCLDSDLTAQANLTERCAASVNFLLACFHKDQTSTFQPEDRQMILRTMEPRVRQIWHGLS